MDILIKNMEMPKEMECVEILLFSNGHCSFRKHERDEWVEAWAVALPSHGDLVDISPIKDKMSRIMNRYDIDDWGGKLADLIENAETIVEASNE